MIFRTTFFIICISLTTSVFGQNLYLSNGIINEGAYQNINTHSINIKNYTGYNSVIFSTGLSEYTKPILVVSKKADSVFRPVNWIKLEKKIIPSIFYADINWKEDGDFKLSVIEGQKELISEYYSVNLNEDDNLIFLNTSDDYSKYNDPENTFYYIDSKVEFYESVTKNNEPVNLKTEFPVGNVAVLISNNKPIIANEIKVSVYKIKGKNNQILYEEKNFQIDSGEMTVSFNYYFGIKGSFLVSVYANDDIWINDGNIKIK